MPTTADHDRAAQASRRVPAPGGAVSADLHDLVRLATLAASSHNTQPWKFRLAPHAITVLPDFTRRCPVVDPDDSHLFKSLGCAVENLVHAAAAQRFGSEVEFDGVAGGITVRLARSAAARETDLSRAIAVRQCTKRPYDGTAVATDQLARLEASAQGAGARAILLTDRAALRAVTEHVTEGNLAQLSDRAFRRELASWIRFNPAEALRRGDGLSGRAAGQPALPRWLATPLLGLILTPRAQADADAKAIAGSAGVAVFATLANDPAAWVEAGRSYERFALQAAALGIRTAFINQPIEVPGLRPRFESWLGLRDERAMLMVRFGHAPLAPYSLRRPVADVLVED